MLKLIVIGIIAFVVLIVLAALIYINFTFDPS